MQATTNVPKASLVPRPSSAKSPVSDALGGRQATFAPAASPRISCHSRWWSALAQGGVKGWHQWFVGVQKYEQLSVADRLDMPARASAAISSALKLAASSQKISVVDFSKLLEKAQWYGVDVNSTIDSALLELNVSKMEGIKIACVNHHALNWLVQGIDERIKAVSGACDLIKDSIYKSALLSRDGMPVDGPGQEKYWRKVDQHFDSIGHCHLQDHLTRAFAKDGVWKLLPFAERRFQNSVAPFKVLEQVYCHAWKKLADTKIIDFKMLNDAELSTMVRLTDHVDLKHHAFSCKKEIERRKVVRQCEALALHLKARISWISMTSPETGKVKATAAGPNVFEGLGNEDISRVTLQVIAGLSPEIVLELKELDSESLSDMWLNEVAKAQLAAPCIKLMSDSVLIEYLKLKEGKISLTVRNQLEVEAGKRSVAILNKGFDLLGRGLKSDSYSKLINFVQHFSECVEIGIKLKDAAVFQDRSNNFSFSFELMLSTLKDEQKIDLLKEFQAVFVKFDDDQKNRVWHLIRELDRKGQHTVSQWLKLAVGQIPKTLLPPLSKRDDKTMKEVIADFILSKPVAPSHAATQLAQERGIRFLALFEIYMLEDAYSRKAMTADGLELPVCQQFVADQRYSNLQVERKRFLNAHIPFEHANDLGRAHKFVKQMRNIKGISEEQIMTASQLASQASGAVLVMLARDQNLFSISNAEAAEMNRTEVAGWGLSPSALDHRENFFMDKDGSLMAHVVIFSEQSSNWLATNPVDGASGSVMVETDPKKSSFFAELKFKIDKSGKLEEAIFENSGYERLITNVLV